MDIDGSFTQGADPSQHRLVPIALKFVLPRKHEMDNTLAECALAQMMGEKPVAGSVFSYGALFIEPPEQYQMSHGPLAVFIMQSVRFFFVLLLIFAPNR